MATVSTRSTEAAPDPAARPDRKRRGVPRWLAALAALAALAWVVLTPPPLPAGGTRLGAFSPEFLGTAEQAAWEAYYFRQWPRLFWELLQIMRTQFGLSWAQALYAAYLNTQAQLIFARQGDSGGEALDYLRRFYALVKEPVGGRYDIDRVTAAEMNWWVVHRHRHDYADYSALVQAIAELYAETYQVPVAGMQEAARHRVKAVDLSDQWLDQQMPPGSPLLGQVKEELIVGYRALKAALS